MQSTILLLICLAVVGNAFISTRNNRLYDEQNRERIFHGVNVVMKVPPYIPNTKQWNVLNSFT